MNEEVVDRLDKIAAILQLAFAEQLLAARARLDADPVSATALRLTGDWTAGTELVAAIMTATGKSRAVAYARLGELRDSHVLVDRTSGRSTEYKASGVI
jgi:hypothetical protein